jgi:flagellar biosynthesis/type III secretory pathway M-ring protein FliF/YscJ
VARARAAEQERLLAHEKEMAAITAVERSKTRNRKIAIGSVVAILLAVLGSYAFVIKPALEHKALEAERARQEQQMALEQKERAQEDLVEAQQRALEAEEAKEEYQEKLEAREQRAKDREARAKERPKPRAKPKKKGCAPDDPLCGLDLD